MKKLLVPVGFLERGAMYVRVQRDVVQAIYFQTAQSVSRYVVNLGWHYLFLPGMMRYEPMAPERAHFLDFVFRGRLQDFYTPPRRELWLPCNTDEATIAFGLEQQAKSAVESLDDFAKKWPTPAVLLTAISPEAIELRKGTDNDDPIGAIARELLPEWDSVPNFDVLYLLCALALREKKHTLAMQYYEIALEEPARPSGRAALRRMIGMS